MKLAYLILAHHQPLLLARLVDRLLERGVHAFVYIDGRSDIRPFREACFALDNPWLGENLHFVEDRRKIAYMGFSMVEAVLRLMDRAATSERFKYYTLLSGVDYPVKPREVIRDFFAEANQELIVYWKLADRPSWLHKVEYYYFCDWIPVRGLLPPKLSHIRKASRYLPYVYWKTFRKHRDRFPKRRFPFPGVEPYGGSQWWSLTHEAVQFVLEFVREQPNFSRFYRFTHSPDEMFFQTILLNSELGEKAIHFERYHRWSIETPYEEKTDTGRIPEESFNMRYIDWSGPPSGAPRGYPAVLDESDFESLRGTSSLFARKFDQHTSSRLLDRIDRSLLGVEAGLPRAKNSPT